MRDRTRDRSLPYLVAGAAIGSAVAAVLTTWFLNRKRGVTPLPATVEPPPFEPGTIPVVKPERLALDSIRTLHRLGRFRARRRGAARP